MNTFKCANFEVIWYLFYYFKNPTIDYLSHQLMDFKDDHEPQLAAFPELINEAFSKTKLKFDFIARVLGSKELIAQQPNRVRDIAIAIKNAIGGVYVPRLLSKNRETKPLKGLNLAARKKELKDVYQFGKEIELNNASILIVDDISTTKTTFEVIAELIKSKYPRSKIYGFCLAKTSSKEWDGVSKNEPGDVDYYNKILAQHKPNPKKRDEK